MTTIPQPSPPTEYEYDARCGCGYRWYLRLVTPTEAARCPKCGGVAFDLRPLSDVTPPQSPPTASPPASSPAGYGYVKAGRSLNIAGLTVGAIGAVIGLGPFIFGVFAAAFGVAAIVLGFVAYRAARAANGHSGRVAMGLGALALGLGIFGMVTVDQAVNDLEDDLENIGVDVSYVPPTADEIDAASDDQLWTMWGDAPVGSATETKIENELRSRGQM